MLHLVHHGYAHGPDVPEGGEGDKESGMRMKRIPISYYAFKSFLSVVILLLLPGIFVNEAKAQNSNESCSTPKALQDGAFSEPMRFAIATNKGNMNTSSWISATGKIEVNTPARFLEFLENEQYVPSQIVLHSPGGNLAAGMQIGRMIREAGMTVHIGATERMFESYTTPCDTWWDEVNAGICVSSCAYAFLGGRERFVDSPYYPTSQNLLGFHQFHGNMDRGADLLSAEEVAQIETSTLSIAQALTGEIVLYAMEMGVDARIVAFASATSSKDLYYPTVAELDTLSIASGSGLKPWFMEPYGEGLVTVSKPQRSDSMLNQITAFCGAKTRIPSFLITMDLATPSYPDPNDLPLNAIELTIDDRKYAINKPDITLRYADDKILITVPVYALRDKIISAGIFSLRLDAARVMGGFSEGGRLSDLEKKSLALAWRNCI